MHEHHLGIAGSPAPELDAVTWLQGVPDGTPLRLDAISEPLIYLYFFQSWCPGCHAHGFPTMATVRNHVRAAGREDLIRFVAVQTVFEGFESNTAQAARDSLARHGLEDIALGHDGRASERTMSDYRTGGTPWTAIIGPGSPRRVLADGFQVDADQVIAWIDAHAEALGTTASRESSPPPG